MTSCFFVSDLHGRAGHYRSLLAAIERERPCVVLLGGDLLPSGSLVRTSSGEGHGVFLAGFLASELRRVRAVLGAAYPRVLLVLGNDDARDAEGAVRDLESQGLWEHVHGRAVDVGGFEVFGYAFSPPSPFLLKDWERYDVSRYVDPGCVSPEDGVRTTAVTTSEARFATIARDLEALAGERSMERAVFLFHAPPYGTNLDRAALDGRRVEDVELDVHVGSIAIRRFIEAHQPWLTLHGHVHESARLTGSWRDALGRTKLLSAAHDGPELALVRLDLERPEEATRELIETKADT